jgi:TRAP-type C4-dicarboxylate transport system permease small subunit
VKLDVLTRRLEQVPLVGALALATLLPLIDAVGRPFGGFHIPGSAAYVQQLTLWLAFVGGLVATREGKHLTLSTAELFGEGLARRVARVRVRRCGRHGRRAGLRERPGCWRQPGAGAPPDGSEG